MPNLKEKIGSGADVLSELDGSSIEDVANVILELLEETDVSYWNATTLLRDLVLRSPKSTIFASRFRQSFLNGDHQAIVERLEAGLKSEFAMVRRWSVYTLGKIGSKKSLPKLRRLFEWSLDNDPLLISSLVFEISWLGKKSDTMVQAIKTMAASDSFLNRWQAIDVIRSTRDIDSWESTLEELRKDSHPFVRDSAAGGKYPFEAVALAFMAEHNHLPNYSVTQLESFASSYMAEKANLQS